MLQRTSTYVLLLARWNSGLIDLGYITFAPGDYLYEHFYSDRWYNIYEIYSAQGTHKGWYCNITRPAQFDADCVESEDLELDVFISPDRQQINVLDEDEFAERGLAVSDPFAYQAALDALDEVQCLAQRGNDVFCIVR